MKYLSLLILLILGLILGIGSKSNLDIVNGFKTAILTLTKSDLVVMKPRGGIKTPFFLARLFGVEVSRMKRSKRLAVLRSQGEAAQFFLQSTIVATLHSFLG